MCGMMLVEWQPDNRPVPTFHAPAESPMEDRPTTLKTYQTYIDGKGVDAASGKTLQSYDPYTGEPWALIPECDKVDVDRAVEAASRALGRGSWQKMRPTERVKVLRRL